jgi:hypothetical protein
MSLRYWYLSISLLLSLAFSLGIVSIGNAQDLSVQRFVANASGTDVLLSWDLKSTGSGITEFRILRKVNQEQNFTQITSLPAQGGKVNYEFWDRTIFKETPKWIQYRLVIVRNGQQSPIDTYITVNPTSAQRTWGSIKSMFK